MWSYIQANGHMLEPNGILLAIGYAGRGEGKNNPSLQAAHDLGPLPTGTYLISPPADDAQVGEYAMRLIPSPTNQMYLRSGFFIHGDNPAHPGQSSDGCIVLPREAREAIWQSGDHSLQVLSYEEAYVNLDEE